MKVAINRQLKVFGFPNYLKFAYGDADGVDVGELSDEDASAYWDWAKDHWMAHVDKRRKKLSIQESSE